MDKSDLKKAIETYFDETLNYDIQVEFVTDVAQRSREITLEDREKWNNAYDADSFVGLFIPETEKHKAYILIKDEREFGMLVESCFHELMHAEDYLWFLRRIFCGNKREMMISQLYVTFQVYSEFKAKKFGWLQFLKCIDYEDMTKLSQANAVLETAKQVYRDKGGIINKYQFLMHSIQYLGCLYAIYEYDESYIDLDSATLLIDDLEDLSDIFSMLLDDKIKDKAWFERFDKCCREYVR